MNPIDERDRQDQVVADEDRRAKYRAQQFRKDVQFVMSSPDGRRVIWSFIEASGQELTAYRDTTSAMAHAIGWQDAGRWWLDAIRQHCPERETDMRAEARRNAREGTKETDDDN